jgi:hypothetical protein
MKNSLLHCYYFSARTHPPRASTILLDMNNPNPVPSYDFVERSLGDILASISIPTCISYYIISAAGQAERRCGYGKECRVCGVSRALYGSEPGGATG